ncbi:MAG: type II toxin-antitoxin system RelE/ParE family toxin [Candidatus Binatia bacterium]
MIRSFADQGTEDVFNGRNTRASRQSCPRELWAVAGRKLDQLDSVERLDELRIPPGNRLEALAGDRKGQHSIRINERYRICFRWTNDGPTGAQIVDYH